MNAHGERNSKECSVPSALGTGVVCITFPKGVRMSQASCLARPIVRLATLDDPVKSSTSAKIVARPETLTWALQATVLMRARFADEVIPRAKAPNVLPIMNAQPQIAQHLKHTCTRALHIATSGYGFGVNEGPLTKNIA